MTDDIYEEVWGTARAIFAKLDVRSKSHGLNKIELPRLYSLRAGRLKLGDGDTAIRVSLEIVRREIELARRSNSLKSHALVVQALISLLRHAASSSKGTTASAKAMSVPLVSGMQSQPGWLVRYLGTAPKAAKPNDVKVLTGLTIDDWSAFAARVARATVGRTTPGSALNQEPAVVDLDVASRLSRLAAKEAAKVGQAPSYDLTDRDVRISRVTVTGFRGSAGTVSLDLTKNGQPADLLLWGDNGVGKSTLVDGIEFALQHRVDRSADFNSSLRSSVRNLSVPAAHAEVELSDGSVIERSLVTNKAGRDEPSHFDVRPGFRIAPLVIRRADILRFLDTDALSTAGRCSLTTSRTPLALSAFDPTRSCANSRRNDSCFAWPETI